jgi:hypothetical protein
MPAHNQRRTRMVSLSVELQVLAVDADFEPITLAAYTYRQQNVYPYIEGKGWQLQRCQEALAKRSYVAPAASKSGVVYITGVGHGKYDQFTGQYFDVIFSIGNYSQDESKSKIVHLLSCETARDLGPDFVKNGCLAYFGYDEDFTFQMDDANVFFECDAEIDRGFADGQTAADVYTRAISVFNQKIAQFRANGSNYKAAQLEYDRDHLRAPASGSQWGSPSAKLS